MPEIGAQLYVRLEAKPVVSMEMLPVEPLHVDGVVVKDKPKS